MTAAAGRTGFNRLATLAAIVLAVWSLALPMPLWLCALLTALPPLAIVVAWCRPADVALLAPPQGHPRNLAPLLLLPPLGLAMAAALDYAILDWQAALGGATVLGALLTLSTVAVSACGAGLDLRGRPVGIAGLFLLTGLTYGWGALVQWNGRLDDTPPATAPRHVLDTSPTDVKRNAWYLRLAPASPGGAPERVRVTRDVNARAAIGAPVCAVVHPGAFGIAYREFAICEELRR